MLNWKAGILGVLLLGATVAADGAPERGFLLKDRPGKHLDVMYKGKIVARYMYAYDISTKELLHNTYKPFLHIFDGEGKAPITKGPGGKYTHHRGIFIGWSKMEVGGQKYDRWHMKDGAQVHQKFLVQEATATGATVTSLVHWQDRKRGAMVEEDRRFDFRVPPRGGHVLVDVTSTIKATTADVFLKGDPEHAGIQYRPADEVDYARTVYVFPGENADVKKDRDYPWVGETYTLHGKKYSVVIMNHPDNPKGTRFSAYRDYGRFGAYPEARIAKGGKRTFKYRFMIALGEMPSVELIQKTSNDFTGANDPAPKVKVVSSQSKKKKKKK